MSSPRRPRPKGADGLRAPQDVQAGHQLFGYEAALITFLVISAVLSVLGVVVFFALALWAAREDGRDQRRRDAR